MNCLGIAKRVCLVSGDAECETKLSAFDKALIKAGIHDYNLIPVSSILAEDTKISHNFEGKIEKGSFVPCVLTSLHSNQKGDRLVSIIGCAKSVAGIGFVAELSEKNVLVSVLKERIRHKLWLFAKARKTRLEGKIHFTTATHTTKKCGCTIAAAIYVF